MIRKLRESKEMPYVLWVLDGDTRQWEMYKGVDDAKQFVRDNDYDEFLDELNTQVFPNETYYNNYIDWIVIPAGEEPRKFDTHKFYNSLKYESMRRRLYESNSNLFGVKLYDPYSGEYVVYWSQDRDIVREIYNTLRDHTWIRYDDLYDFVYQINPKFNKFTWEDIGFEWDGDDAFISDGVHESEGEIDIIYELPLDTKHRTESISRRRRSNESIRRNRYKGLR